MAKDKIIKVVCGIIWKENKIFIARRKPEKSLGGYWEFPGGKIEKGEDPETALARELKEELGMEIMVGKYLGENIHNYDTFTIELISHKCEFVSASYQLTDHDAYIFVSPEELLNYKLAPADIYFIQFAK